MTPMTAPSVRFIDGFIELLGYVQSFRQTAAEKQPAYEEVRSEILRLLKQSERLPGNSDGSFADYDQARYAVCAWIDESILGSAWRFKGRWRPELLQRTFYHSADAGEQFFRRLNGLAGHEGAIREVFYLCLALGFKGRYCNPDDADTLEQLKDRHLKLLFNGAFDQPSVASLEEATLFPDAYAQRPALPRPKPAFRQFAWSIAFAAPAFLFVTLFLVYRFTLFNVGQNILKAVSL